MNRQSGFPNYGDFANRETDFMNLKTTLAFITAAILSGCAGYGTKTAAKPENTHTNAHTGEAFAARSALPPVCLWGKNPPPVNTCSSPEKCGKNLRITNVSTPRMELFLSPSKNRGGGFVIVCPGGGYAALNGDHEGYKIAKYLNAQGVSAAVLWYRVPDNYAGALCDVQRAIRVARANAKNWGFSPSKIAVMGFSAGADLAARAGSDFAKKTYEKIDATDEVSARPNMTILIYPAYIDEPMYRSRWVMREREKLETIDYSHDYKLSHHLKVSKDTPPAFIVQTADDKVCKNSSIAYFLALKNAGVPAELLYCQKGGHGYSLAENKADGLVSMWPKVLARHLEISGYSGSRAVLSK